MAALETNKKISSLVFMDFESTGIPTYEFYSRATEVCLIAVERQHFESLDEEEKELRIQNKLRLCAYPHKRISPNSTHLTGLSNENLQNQKPVNGDFVQALTAFLKRLPAPVCLIAHNGNKFDFPLLQAEIRNVGCTLPEYLLCADSYCAFRSLLEDLPTQTNFLPAPLEFPEIAPAQPAQTVPEVDKDCALPNTSDEESGWLDEELVTEQKYIYESLGFAIEYDDTVLDDEIRDALSLEMTTLKTSDIAVKDEQGSVVSIKNNKVSASKVILLDCDNPNCECSDCTSQNVLRDVTKEQSCIAGDFNGDVTPVASVSESGIAKKLNDVDKIMINEGENLNGKSQVRKSVIVLGPRNSTALPLFHEHTWHKEPGPSTSVPLPKDVDALLEDDMDFVVSYVQSPEFKNMDANIDIEFSKQEADITPLKSIGTRCTPTRFTRKQLTKQGESLGENKEQQGEMATFGKKQDKVKKRLFAEQNLNIAIASPDMNADEFSATVLTSSRNGQIMEADIRLPPKCISNGETLKCIGHASAAAFDEMSNQKITIFDKSPATPLASKGFPPNIYSEHEMKCEDAVRRSPPKRLCNGITLTNNNPELACTKEITTSVNGTASVTPSLQATTNLAVIPQKNTQQRPKIKYGLEALHELLIGAKPPVSHTAEDDTEALIRVCRTKRGEFCLWVDNHAVPLNLIRPMWEKKKN